MSASSEMINVIHEVMEYFISLYMDGFHEHIYYNMKMFNNMLYLLKYSDLSDKFDIINELNTPKIFEFVNIYKNKMTTLSNNRYKLIHYNLSMSNYFIDELNYNNKKINTTYKLSPFLISKIKNNNKNIELFKQYQIKFEELLIKEKFFFNKLSNLNIIIYSKDILNEKFENIRYFDLEDHFKQHITELVIKIKISDNEYNQQLYKFLTIFNMCCDEFSTHETIKVPQPNQDNDSYENLMFDNLNKLSETSKINIDYKDTDQIKLNSLYLFTHIIKLSLLTKSDYMKPEYLFIVKTYIKKISIYILESSFLFKYILEKVIDVTYFKKNEDSNIYICEPTLIESYKQILLHINPILNSIELIVQNN